MIVVMIAVMKRLSSAMSKSTAELLRNSLTQANQHLLNCGLFHDKVTIIAKHKIDGCYEWYPVDCNCDGYPKLEDMPSTVSQPRSRSSDRGGYTIVNHSIKLVIPFPNLPITTAYRAVVNGKEWDIESISYGGMSTKLSLFREST